MEEVMSALDGLRSKDVSIRAAAVRVLSEQGGFNEALTLIGLATSDKSRSVRIYAASAAAEILSRHRGAYDQAPLPSPQQSEILQALAGFDPENLPSLLLCYSSFPTSVVIKRLMRMLRDPRGGVRTGAVAAVRRMALSGAAVLEGTSLREWVGDTLSHPQLPTSTAMELLCLIGEAGWEPLRPHLQRGTLFQGKIKSVSEEAISRLDRRKEPAIYRGIWVDEHRDVLQQRPAIIGQWFAQTDPPAQIDTTRIVFAPRIAEEGDFIALQRDRRTFWRLTPDRAVDFICAVDARLIDQPVCAQILEDLLEGNKSARATRARAILHVRLGHGKKALDVLSKALSAKKPRNDLFFLQALALNRLGQTSQAQAALQRYLKGAKATDRWRSEAEEMLVG